MPYLCRNYVLSIHLDISKKAYYNIVNKRGKASFKTKRKVVIMAQFNITRKQALSNVLDALAENGIEFENDTLAVVENMFSQLNAKSSKPKGTSKTAKRNLELAQKIAVDMDGKTFTAKEVKELGYAEIGSIQKATAILTLGAEKGVFDTIQPKTKSGSLSYIVL